MHKVKMAFPHTSSQITYVVLSGHMVHIIDVSITADMSFLQHALEALSNSNLEMKLVLHAHLILIILAKPTLYVIVIEVIYGLIPVILPQTVQVNLITLMISHGNYCSRIAYLEVCYSQGRYSC